MGCLIGWTCKREAETVRLEVNATQVKFLQAFFFFFVKAIRLTLNNDTCTVDRIQNAKKAYIDL